MPEPQLAVVRPSSAPDSAPGLMTVSLGRSGLNAWAGQVQEEWLKDLRGSYGIKTYREMADNDPHVGAGLYVIKMMLRGAKWQVVEEGKDGVLSPAGQLIQSCIEDLGDVSWDDFIDEALSHVEFGWAYHEILWKLRSGPSMDVERSSLYTDGRIGWGGFPLRGQETLDRWDLTDSGMVRGMWQTGSMGDLGKEVPDPHRPYIPRTKAIHFRTTKRKNNPEGRSMLRNAYRPWYFKKNFEWLEAVGAERDLAGYPVIRVPAPILADNPPPEYRNMLAYLEKAIQEIKRDEREGMILPNDEAGYGFELVRAAGSRQFDTGALIERKAREILFAILADFIVVGHEDVGSYAMNTSKIGLFTTSCNAMAKNMEDTIHRDLTLPTLAMNGLRFNDPKKAPRIKCGRISVRDVQTKVTALKDMNAAGQMPFTPNLELLNTILRELDLPEMEEKDLKPPPMPMLPGGKPPRGGPGGGL